MSKQNMPDVCDYAMLIRDLVICAFTFDGIALVVHRYNRPDWVRTS